MLICHIHIQLYVFKYIIHWMHIVTCILHPCMQTHNAYTTYNSHTSPHSRQKYITADTIHHIHACWFVTCMYAFTYIHRMHILYPLTQTNISRTCVFLAGKSLLCDTSVTKKTAENFWRSLLSYPRYWDTIYDSCDAPYVSWFSRCECSKGRCTHITSEDVWVLSLEVDVWTRGFCLRSG